MSVYPAFKRMQPFRLESESFGEGEKMAAKYKYSYTDRSRRARVPVDWEFCSGPDPYRADLEAGLGKAMAENVMSKNPHLWVSNKPYYFMLSLTKTDKSDIFQSEWSLMVTDANPTLWDLATDREKESVAKLNVKLSQLSVEDRMTIIQDLFAGMTNDQIRKVAGAWFEDPQTPRRGRKKGKMYKLFEVFVVNKETKYVTRSLAWGEDPQAIREKALLDAGLTSAEYDENQIIVKFIHEFDFPKPELESED